MPKGCDFTCRNKACRGFEKVIVMHGVWPTMHIDDAIAESGDDIERMGSLETKKTEGRLTALFVYPRDKDRQPIGYRIQLYCPSCLIVDNKDCVPDINEANQMYINPPVCDKCSSHRLSLKTAIETGLPCPFCQVKMIPFHWFTK